MKVVWRGVLSGPSQEAPLANSPRASAATYLADARSQRLRGRIEQKEFSGRGSTLTPEQIAARRVSACGRAPHLGLQQPVAVAPSVAKITGL